MLSKGICVVSLFISGGPSVAVAKCRTGDWEKDRRRRNVDVAADDDDDEGIETFSGRFSCV